MSEKNYRTRVHVDPQDIDRSAWNALLSEQAEPSPFMRHEYLCALHANGCATAATGWAPRFITITQGDELVAACPAYLKAHSYGEYVFDWAWAQAYNRNGLAYYPKLVVAVPFTPVSGCRLMARNEQALRQLMVALDEVAQDEGCSSTHILFMPEDTTAMLDESQWLRRQTVQFHWANREEQQYDGFDDFLASLHRDKRKKIKQERRRVAQAGIQLHAVQGADITASDWHQLWLCYANTYAAHQSTPYLNEAFFLDVGKTMAEHWLVFKALCGHELVATSLIGLQPEQGRAYGRYWGCTRAVPMLHFEACFYTPVQWCIANGYRRFEGGAQGEHKLARGLLPERAHSVHRLAHPAFQAAVARHLLLEAEGVAGYVNELNDHNPYRP